MGCKALDNWDVHPGFVFSNMLGLFMQTFFIILTNIPKQGMVDWAENAAAVSHWQISSGEAVSEACSLHLFPL